MKNWKWFVGFLYLVIAASVAARFSAAAGKPRELTVAARRFEFSPNQITLKKGEAVKLLLISADVKHGFLMKALGMHAEIAPGETAEVMLTPQVTGTFSAICDHFCGAGHGNMKMTIVVE